MCLSPIEVKSGRILGKEFTMASQSIPPSQALKQAINALQRGDKHAARTWAQIAASLAPDMEEPWLILAAVARPHASIAYLERALEINPESTRARAGLVWAHQQHAHAEDPCGQADYPSFLCHGRSCPPRSIQPSKAASLSQIPPKALAGIRIFHPAAAPDSGCLPDRGLGLLAGGGHLGVSSHPWQSWLCAG